MAIVHKAYESEELHVWTQLFYKEVSQLVIIFASPEDIIYKYQEKWNRIIITLKETTHKMIGD